jgi:transposase
MVPFPPCPLGGEQVAHGYKGKGVLSHLMSDAQGHPVALCTTPASGNERVQVKPLLRSIQAHLPLLASPIVLEADRGYDAKHLRLFLLNRFIYPRIPYRKIAGRAPITLQLPSFRWRIERTFAWLKIRYRRFLCRFEKTVLAWQSILDCMLIHYWLQLLER